LRINLYKEAADAYKKAVGLDPSLASAWQGLGNAYVRMGMNEEADIAHREAIRREASKKA
jgi:Flp pilus assembly protein TadD